MEELIDGLESQEWVYLQTPLSSMDKEQRMAAFNIYDKRENFIRAENERLRKEDAESARSFDSDHILVVDDTGTRPRVAVD